MGRARSGPELQVARVLGGLAVDQARIGRAGGEALLRLGGRLEQLLHRGRELVELGDAIDDLLHGLRGQRLVVGEEVVGPGEIGFGLLVQARVDGVVRPLEEALLAVGDELDAAGDLGGRGGADPLGGDDHGCGDVVFGLDLGRGVEVLADLEGAPLAGGEQAHAEVGAAGFAVVDLQFVAGLAVDDVDGEVLAPVLAPLGLVETLDQEDQGEDLEGMERSQALYSSV